MVSGHSTTMGDGHHAADPPDSTSIRCQLCKIFFRTKCLHSCKLAMSVCLICFATDLNADADTREVLAIPVLWLFIDLLWWKGAILGAWGDWDFLRSDYGEECICWVLTNGFFCLCACADGLPDLLQWGMQFPNLLAEKKCCAQLLLNFIK
jgi:hypothetical protein